MSCTVMLQHMVRSAILVIPWFWQCRWERRSSQVEFSSPGYCTQQIIDFRRKNTISKSLRFQRFLRFWPWQSSCSPPQPPARCPESSSLATKSKRSMYVQSSFFVKILDAVKSSNRALMIVRQLATMQPAQVLKVLKGIKGVRLNWLGKVGFLWSQFPPSNNP